MKKTISVILAAVMLLALLPLSAVAEEWIRVEDTDDQIQYIGHAWGPWSGDGNDSGASVMVTNDEVGQSASLTFTGTAVRYVSRKHPLLGVAEIFIDDVSQGDYDLYSTGWADYQKLIFEKSGLTPEEHTIKIVLKGAHDGDPGGSRLMLDYFEYQAVVPDIDLTLSSLSVDGYPLVPDFSPETASYTVEVSADTPSITLFAAATDAEQAEVRINGLAALAEGNIVEVKPGTSRITIEVAPKTGGEAMTYTVVVKRPSQVSLSGVSLSGGWEITPAFSPDIYEYEISGDYNDSITLTPETADDGFITKVNEAETVSDGAATIPLKDGLNPVTVSVRDGADAVKAENLIAKWNFENNLKDAGPNRFDTMKIGTVDFAAGITGMAAKFNGSSYLTVSNHDALNPDNQITLMAWMKPNGVTKGQDIIFKDQSYRARIDISLGAGAVQGAMALRDDSGNLSWYTNNAHVQSQPGTAAAGSWQHLAVTYDGRDVRVYLDGLLVANTSNSARRTLNKSGNSVLIGQDFVGLIDDLRIYDAALSPEEIAQVVKDEEPKATYRFTVNNDIKNLPVDEALETISGASAETLNDVLTGEYERVYRLIGLSVDDALALENNAPFFEVLMAQKPFASGDDLKEKFNGSLFINKFNTADKAERETMLRSDTLGLTIDEQNLAEVLDLMQGKTWKTKQELIQAYYSLNYQAGIKTLIGYQQLRGLVERTADALDMTIKDAKESILSQAYKNVYARVSASSDAYADFAYLLTDLNDEIDDLKNQGGGSSGGGSSGGSSGGRGGNYAVSNDVISSGEQNDSSLEYPPIVREAATFSDLAENHWAKPAVDDLYRRNILSGYEDGAFRPDQPVTRAEFSKMAVTLFGFSIENKDCSFNDVPADSWAYPYIAALCAEEIANGTGDGNFGAGEGITRQDMAVMLYRITQNKQVTLGNAQSNDFSDAAAVADYAKTAVETLCAAGVLTGMDDGSFAPQMPVTRAQAAVMMKRFMEAGGAR